jgi:uncharacterized protein (DUF39 family)
MSSDFIKGCILTRYGVSLYVGLGVPIPVLNEEVAKSTGVSNQEIVTKVIDYSVPSRARPKLGKVSYTDLKSGSIEIDGREVRTAPISSFRVAETVANELKQRIAADNQYITLDKNRCVECGVCVSFCETGVFTFDDNWTFSFSPELCVECEICGDVCPQRAISLRN